MSVIKQSIIICPVVKQLILDNIIDVENEKRMHGGVIPARFILNAAHQMYPEQCCSDCNQCKYKLLSDCDDFDHDFTKERIKFNLSIFIGQFLFLSLIGFGCATIYTREVIFDLLIGGMFGFFITAFMAINKINPYLDKNNFQEDEIEDTEK